MTSDETADAPPPHVRVGVADYAITTFGATLSTSGLGSCLAIALVDLEANVGGLLHVMLPTAEPDVINRAKYTDAGLELVFEEVVEAGATLDNVRAKIAGGSRMLDLGGEEPPIGERNLDVAREILSSVGIEVVAEDVGGTYGRSVRFDARTGDFHIKTAHRGEKVI